MKHISATFDNLTGNLLLEELDCLIHSGLNQVDFLSLAKPYLLYKDEDFFYRYGFFHFGLPIKLWGDNFRLTVYFPTKSPETSISCSGYSLQIFEYSGHEQDEPITILFEKLLTVAIGSTPTSEPYTEDMFWHTRWGSVRLGAIIQNGTEPQIGIGWSVAHLT